MESRTLAEGEILFRENEEGQSMFVVKSGQVSVYKTINGEELELTRLGKGEIIGEMGLFLNEARAATIKAVEATEVVEYDMSGFKAAIMSNPEVALKVIRMQVQRLRRADQNIKKLEGIKRSYEIMYQRD